MGTFQMSRAAHPHLKKGSGVIVNISATLHYGATFYQVRRNEMINSVQLSCGFTKAPQKGSGDVTVNICAMLHYGATFCQVQHDCVCRKNLLVSELNPCMSHLHAARTACMTA